MGKKNNKQQKINENEYIKIEANEKWLCNIVDEKFYDKSFYKIIDFFVLHSPCKVSSYTPKALESLGWINPWQSIKFRKAFDEIIGIEEDKSFLYHQAKNHMKIIWESLGRKSFYDVDGFEFVVITHAGESNPRMDILHHIRNSFAHGRFSVVLKDYEFYIYMEDVTKIKGLNGLYVTARMCIKKSSLIKLIDFFEKKGSRAKELKSLFQK